MAWDVDDVITTFDGMTVDGFVSFNPEGGNKESKHITGSHGPTDYQHKHREPKWSLKVSSGSSILTRAKELAKSKDKFQITFQTPDEVVNCIDCVVDDVVKGEVKDEAPVYEIKGLALKIED